MATTDPLKSPSQVAATGAVPAALAGGQVVKNPNIITESAPPSVQTTAQPQQPQPTTQNTPITPQSIAGVDFAQFGPQNTIRGTQIMPNAQAAGTGLQTAQGYVETPEAMQLRQMALADLQGLSGPNRGQIAQDVFSQLEDASRPQFERDLRGVGQKAAAWGRMGAGMTTSNLGDVISERERELALQKRGLSSEAAALALSDAQGIADARLRGASQFAGEDLARSGMTATLQGQGFNQGSLMRDEMRSERGYQDQLARQATDDAVRQLLLEDQLLNSASGRQETRLSQLSGAGFGTPPINALQTYADSLGGQASGTQDALARLLMNYQNGQGG